MKIGISPSCFYPEKVEDGFKKICELGAKTSEMFFNSPSEMKPPILSELKKMKENYGVEIRSVHPCTSGFESHFFFSAYDRRRLDGVEFYKNYFEAANQLGADTVVFHGATNKNYIEPEFYAECYGLLHNVAREQGVYMAHENVREHLCCDPEYMKKVGDCIGEDFQIVLDIKQCRRSGFSEYDFIRLFKGQIAQVHISDYTRDMDCIPPGFGEYDFEKLFAALKDAGYDKTALIELYRKGFGEPWELKKAMDFLYKKQ